MTANLYYRHDRIVAHFVLEVFSLYETSRANQAIIKTKRPTYLGGVAVGGYGRGDGEN